MNPSDSWPRFKPNALDGLPGVLSPQSIREQEDLLRQLKESNEKAVASRTPVGDITSSAKGTGARWNEGKVPYDMLPLRLILQLAWPDKLPDDAAYYVLDAMAAWQCGSDDELDKAIEFAAEGAEGCVTVRSFAEAAKVFQHVTTRAERPYPRWNWMKGMAWSVPLGCIVRHCLAILNGEELDPETGLPHMGHVMCNLLMLKFYQEHYLEGDDRPPPHLFTAG